MSAIETALHKRLVKEGRMISTTAVPDGWLADGELIADARWWAEQEPLKVVK